MCIRDRVYSVPVDGGAPQVRLNGALAPGGEVDDIDISPAGNRVVYTADQDTDEVIELYSVLIGGGGRVKLSAPLGADGDVDQFDLSPDGAWVAFLADPGNDEQFELSLVPTDGSAPPVKVSGPLTVSYTHLDVYKRQG